jgi:hypothetical protein
MTPVRALPSIYTNHQEQSLNVSVKTRIVDCGGRGAAIPGDRVQVVKKWEEYLQWRNILRSKSLNY